MTSKQYIRNLLAEGETHSRAIPDPSSDVYELHTERKTIEAMERTACKWHEEQFRKDGKTPYIEQTVNAILSRV